jgi:hypothetical protein
MMEGQNKNKIEDLKRNLYDTKRNKINRAREGIIHPVEHDVNENWQKDEESKENKKYRKPPLSIFKKFFIVAFVFFLGAMIYAGYNFFGNDKAIVSDEKIEIKVVGNSFSKAGEELPLEIEIINNNSANLELVYLSVEYPKGALNDWSNLERLPRDNIGTIEPGERIVRNVKVALFGEEKSVTNVRVGLEYHPEGSNAVFTKEIYYPVTISAAPISLSFEAPNTTVSNQNITFKVVTTLNTSLPKENPILKVSYPNNFIFDSASPEPAYGNSVWSLGSLTTEKPLEVEISGRIMGIEGDEQVFHAYAGTSKETNPSDIIVNYSSLLHKISINKPFLNTKILVNGLDQDENSVTSGSNVTIVIDWNNNSFDSITDGEIVVSLSGNVLDKNSIYTQDGFYDSLSDQIIFNKSTDFSLSEIKPGQSGQSTFNFKTTGLVGLVDSVKEPSVNIKVSVSGRQSSSGYDYKKLSDFLEKIVKIKSDFQIASSAYYYNGEIPPKANAETSYIVSWTLSNSANSISNAKAISTLPIYVSWVDKVAGSNENITYNQATREITWDIGNVAPYTGIKTNKEVSFVIKIRPSLAQVGQIPILMEKITLMGVDTFAKTEVTNYSSQIMTSLNNDPNYKQISGKVVQ